MLKIIALLFVFSAIAQEKSSLKLHAFTTSTSDNLILREYSIDYQNHRRNLGWAFSDEQEKGFDFGFFAAKRSGRVAQAGPSFKEENIRPRFGYKFSKNYYLQSQLGYSEFTNEQNQIEHSFFDGKILSAYNSETFSISTSLRQGPLVSEMRFPKAIDSQLREKETINNMLFIISKFRIGVNSRYEQYSDDNSLFFQDLDFKYNLSFGEQWILIGFGSEYYRAKNDVTGYWTPRHFVGVGPRIDTSLTLPWGIHLNIGGSLNRFKENHLTYGNGHYLNTSLQFGNREKPNIIIGYENIESQQNGSTWSYDRLYLTTNYFW